MNIYRKLYINVLLKLKNWSSIQVVYSATYKIIIGKINNFDTYKILKNRFKKIKNSSIKATLNYLFFEKLPPKNIIENTTEISKTTNGFPVTCISGK